MVKTLDAWKVKEIKVTFNPTPIWSGVNGKR
jgi:hypothetical protein